MSNNIFNRNSGLRCRAYVHWCHLLHWL